jgi:hypothetical protein
MSTNSTNEEAPKSIRSVYMSLANTKYINDTQEFATVYTGRSPLTYINNALINIKFGSVTDMKNNSNSNTVQYNLMRDSIDRWIVGVSPIQTTDSNVLQSIYRLMVVGADGLVYYDSGASRKDASGNVSNLDESGKLLNSMFNVKRWDNANGQFFINENLGCTVYIQGAGKAVDGTFYENETFYQDNTQFSSSNQKIYPTDYSGPVSYNQEYYTVRQGLSIERPIGFVVLVRETISKIDTIPEYVSPLI